MAQALPLIIYRSSEPTTIDDSFIGVVVGSLCITPSNIYYCTDNTAGAAVWAALGGYETVINANFTAENDKVYNVIANATATDPTPVEGKGYTVNVLAGTCTIDALPFPAGYTIQRKYTSLGWVTNAFVNNTILQALLELRATLETNVFTGRQTISGNALVFESPTPSVPASKDGWQLTATNVLTAFINGVAKFLVGIDYVQLAANVRLMLASSTTSLAQMLFPDGSHPTSGANGEVSRSGNVLKFFGLKPWWGGLSGTGNRGMIVDADGLTDTVELRATEFTAGQETAAETDSGYVDEVKSLAGLKRGQFYRGVNASYYCFEDDFVTRRKLRGDLLNGDLGRTITASYNTNITLSRHENTLITGGTKRDAALPSVASTQAGDRVSIRGINTEWRVTQAANQRILNNGAGTGSTLGVTGFAQSPISTGYSALELEAITTELWIIRSAISVDLG